MTAVLLDTHAFIWALADSPELSPEARRIIQDSKCQKLLSLASVWEMALKLSLRKLTLPVTLEHCLRVSRDAGLLLEPIELDCILAVEHLPYHHRDPFDRLLVSHCLQRGWPILSCDAALDPYGVERVW